jgi:cellulose biosynthesis protein BcsQ
MAGAVDWSLAERAAREVARVGDRRPSAEERARLEEAFRLAEHWLDAGALPQPPDAGRTLVLDREEWIDLAIPMFMRLIGPIAEASTEALVALASQQLGELGRLLEDSPDALDEGLGALGALGLDAEGLDELDLSAFGIGEAQAEELRAQLEQDLGGPVQQVFAQFDPEPLAEATGAYEHVLIDCPPSLNLLTVNALVAAQGVLIPMQCEYYALDGLTALMGTIESIQRGPNPRLRIAGLLRTMFDARNRLSGEVSEQLVGHFGERVFRTIVPRNVRLAEAPSFGRPVLDFDRQSKGALAYLALAGEMLNRATMT